jgi:heme oxygenase (mycobilin-producing)
VSHTVMLDLKLNKGAGVEFLPGLLTSLAETRAYEGCELVETYVDADDPDHIVLWEKWAARTNQEAYISWRAESGMIEALAPILAEPLRIVHLGPAD